MQRAKNRENMSNTVTCVGFDNRDSRLSVPGTCASPAQRQVGVWVLGMRMFSLEKNSSFSFSYSCLDMMVSNSEISHVHEDSELKKYKTKSKA